MIQKIFYLLTFPLLIFTLSLKKKLYVPMFFDANKINYLEISNKFYPEQNKKFVMSKKGFSDIFLFELLNLNGNKILLDYNNPIQFIETKKFFALDTNNLNIVIKNYKQININETYCSDFFKNNYYKNYIPKFTLKEINNKKSMNDILINNFFHK